MDCNSGEPLIRTLVVRRKSAEGARLIRLDLLISQAKGQRCIFCTALPITEVFASLMVFLFAVHKYDHPKIPEVLIPLVFFYDIEGVGMHSMITRIL